ncbi:MAG: hypothetical protein PVJ86_07840 [Phycisphaerales bacterium]
MTRASREFQAFAKPAGSIYNLDTQESVNYLIDPYEAWDKPEKANEGRAKLPQTEAVEE